MVQLSHTTKTASAADGLQSGHNIEHMHKAANEKVITLSLSVNSCSPEGATKLSAFYAL